MAENENSVSFSVTIALKTGKNEQTVAKNSIRKTLTTNTWYDLFEAVTENVPESPDFPGSIWNDFEKNSSVAVSAAQAGEPYYPDPYDEIKTLTDFDKTLRYVKIQVINPESNTPANVETSDLQSKNAFSLLMSSRTQKKKPEKMDKERHRGIKLL